MSCRVLPYDMTRTCMDLRDHYLGYLRDHFLQLILFFRLIPHICPCIALTSFASVSFSQRCMSRVLILLEVVSPPVLSRTRVFWWFPTGLSFYFTFPALPSSSIYLLLTKHTSVVHVLQYLFCIYVCRFSPQILYSSCSWVILSAANIVVCTPFISPSPPRHLVIWLPFTCLHTFFFLPEIIPSSNLVASVLSFFVYSNEAFSRALIKDHFPFIRIPSSRLEFLCSFFLESSLLIILLVFFWDRFVQWLSPLRVTSPAFFPICLRSFSFLPTASRPFSQ